MKARFASFVFAAPFCPGTTVLNDDESRVIRMGLRVLVSSIRLSLVIGNPTSGFPCLDNYLRSWLFLSNWQV